MQSPTISSDLDIWNEQKKLLTIRKLYKKTKDGNKIPKTPIKEGEIWWCKLGINIGNEVYGKGQFFTRPVLIIKKISGYSCIVIPTTSEQKEGSWYHSISFNHSESFLVFPQIRMISTARLEEKIAEISERELEKIKKSAGKFYGFD